MTFQEGLLASSLSSPSALADLRGPDRGLDAVVEGERLIDLALIAKRPRPHPSAARFGKALGRHVASIAVILDERDDLDLARRAGERERANFVGAECRGGQVERQQKRRERRKQGFA